MEPIRGIIGIVDPHYRYKMRKLIIKKEKTKTSITNLKDVASDLKIPDASLIVAFIKKRLAIAINYKVDKAIITRDMDVGKIQPALYEFIDYFVLCKKCKLPELTYLLEKKQLCTQCKGCGHFGSVESNQYTEKVIKEFENKIFKADASKKSGKQKYITDPEIGTNVAEETVVDPLTITINGTNNLDFF